MVNHYTKKQLEELYNCEIIKDTGFDDSHTFWVARGLPLDGYDEPIFSDASGFTLDELHEEIRNNIILPFMVG